MKNSEFIIQAVVVGILICGLTAAIIIKLNVITSGSILSHFF